MTLDTLPPLRDLIARYDLLPQKSLGQNFILDQNITDKIVAHAGSFSGQTVFEIGPGPGGLTRSLLRTEVKRIIALEVDSRAIQALQELMSVSSDRLEVIQNDALRADLLALSSAPRMIVANLPYNIATPLLIKWLKNIRNSPNAFSSMTLMFQKEVGDRILAKPNGKSYGRLSVLAQWICRVSHAFDLPPSVFFPPPKVTSTVVHFVPKAFAEISPRFETVEALTKAAFGQRRKMIRSSLKSYAAALEKSGIDSKKRAENLTVDDFIFLADLIEKNE